MPIQHANHMQFNKVGGSTSGRKHSTMTRCQETVLVISFSVDQHTCNLRHRVRVRSCGAVEFCRAVCGPLSLRCDTPTTVFATPPHRHLCERCRQGTVELAVRRHCSTNEEVTALLHRTRRRPANDVGTALSSLPSDGVVPPTRRRPTSVDGANEDCAAVSPACHLLQHTLLAITCCCSHPHVTRHDSFENSGKTGRHEAGAALPPLFPLFPFPLISPRFPVFFRAPRCPKIQTDSKCPAGSNWARNKKKKSQILHALEMSFMSCLELHGHEVSFQCL